MARAKKDSALIRAEIVATLAEGFGIKETCRKIGCSVQSYYNWRKKNPEFDAACDKVLSDPIHKERILTGRAKADVGVGASWQDIFLALYRRTGDRAAALAQCKDKSALDIENALDKDHDTYDEVFAYRFQEEQQRKLWKIEDNMLTKAEHDAPTSRFALSNLMKERYGKVGGEVTVNQLHWFSERGAGQARDILSDMFEQEVTPEVQLGPALPASHRTDEGS
jgi:hypothetical protein